MKKIYYLTEISFQNAARNKLEKAIANFLENQERKLIIPKNVEAYKKYIINQIKKFNSEFPRCTIKEPFWYRYEPTAVPDIVLFDLGFMGFILRYATLEKFQVVS